MRFPVWLVVGLLCCAATSRPPDGEPFPDDWRPELWTDVYVHNGGADAVVVRVRPLAESVDVDCGAVAEEPGRLLTEPLFGESQSFRLEPDQNFGLRVNNEWDEPASSFANCHAYLLDIDGMPPAVVFWDEGSVPMHTVPGTGYEEGDSPRGGIELMPTEDPDRLGAYELLGPDEIVHLIPPAVAPTGGACAPQSDATRLEWSDPPDGVWDVAAIERGADGCFALDLGVRELDGEITNPRRWYMCAPLSSLGIEADRRIRVSRLTAGTFFDGISIATEDDPSLPQVELWATRGEGFPEFHGFNVAAVPDFECGYAVGENCGTVTRATGVTAGGGSFGAVEMEPGESQELVGDDGTMTVVIAHAEERSALDSACAEGPDTLGLDLEVVALYTQPASE